MIIFVDLVSCSLSPRISRFCGKNGIICVTAFRNDYHCRDVFSFKISGWRQQKNALLPPISGWLVVSTPFLKICSSKWVQSPAIFGLFNFPQKILSCHHLVKGSHRKNLGMACRFTHHAYPPNPLEVFPFSHLPGHGLLNYQPAMAHMGAIGWLR